MPGAVDLGGASQRLLPEHIPLRFFGAAIVAHIIAWLGLALCADQVADFAGGPGPVVATVHVLTLGVLVLTAMGASLQMLPVALGQPIPPARGCTAVFWLTLAGAAGLIGGVATFSRPAIMGGAAAAGSGLMAYAVILRGIVRKARQPRAVLLHVRAALVALVLAVALALLLSFDDAAFILPDHGRIAGAHLLLAAFGFMGMLALGLSYVLIPMFAMGEAPGGWPADLSFAIAVAAVAAGACGALVGQRWIIAAAAVGGLAGCGLHVGLMARAVARRMRRKLGREFVLIRASWALLLAALALGLGLALELLPSTGTGTALFGFLLVFGWLLTLLTGVLQRILPFLASMHTARSSGRAIAPTKLIHDLPLTLHRYCHLAALALVASGIALDVPGVIATGAAVGVGGAIAFAWFAGTVLHRTRAHLLASAVRQGGRV
ncbi:MAG: hypothetical protein U1E33_04970 [Rhodospirillales bacterium]